MIEIPEDVKKEGFKWLEYNKELDCSSQGFYSAPRISSEYPDCSLPLTFDQYNYCSLACNFCVVGDTKISVLGKSKIIKDLKIGDKVISYNIDNSKFEIDVVTNVMNRKVDELFEIELENNKIIKITGEHPVFVKNKGWVNVKNLKENDDVLFWKNPSVAYFMSVKNPMKNKDSVDKKIATDKKFGNYKKASERMSKLRTGGIIPNHTLSEIERKNISIRMRKNNPMFNKDIVNKCVRTKESNSTKSGWFWRKEAIGRDIVSKRMMLNNPMKNPDLCMVTLAKARNTLALNGGVSEGQNKLRGYLLDMQFEFIEEMPIKIVEYKRLSLLDFYLPDFNVCIEYDGHSRHYSFGKENDIERDKLLYDIFGIKTLRIHRDLVFVEHKTKSKVKEFLGIC